MFKFRLQPLLEYRRILQENAQQDFSLKLRALENEKKALAAIAGDRAVLARRYMGLSKGESDIKAEDLGALTSRLELLMIRQEQQERIVAEKEEDKERSRLNMLDAMRNSRMMELLRDRHFGYYRQEVKHRETLLLDEFAARIYSRGETI